MNVKELRLSTTTNIIIDLDLIESLYHKGSLEGANIFAILFKIIEHPRFKPSNEEYIDLTPYQIGLDEWTLLYGYILNGYLPFSEYNDENICILNKCYDTSLKLGGIPRFDEYYREKTEYYREITRKVKIKSYNPMTPHEDTEQKYNWRTISTINRNATYLDTEDITQPISNESFTYIFYIRRLKEANI